MVNNDFEHTGGLSRLDLCPDCSVFRKLNSASARVVFSSTNLLLKTKLIFYTLNKEYLLYALYFYSSDYCTGFVYIIYSREVRGALDFDVFKCYAF